MIVPQTLFKYVQPDRVDVLERNLIRYTQPSALNDPFEGRVLPRGLASREQVLAEATEEFMDQQIQETLKRMPLRGLLREGALRAVKREALRELPRVFDSLSSTMASTITEVVSANMRALLGVLSMTADPSNKLMWSHYTLNGQGFVIGFDTTHPHFNGKKTPEDEFRHLRPVAYRNSRVAGYLVDFTGVELFYVKPKAWEYEREWRIVRPLEDASEVQICDEAQVHLFSIPEGAISHVIVGYAMRERDACRVRNCVKELRYSHVRVSEAHLSSSEFSVDVSI